MRYNWQLCPDSYILEIYVLLTFVVILRCLIRLIHRIAFDFIKKEEGGKYIWRNCIEHIFLKVGFYND